MRFTTVPTIFLLFFFTSYANAQSSVSGSIVDASSGEPLIAAPIRIMQDRTPVAQGLSGTDGSFEIKNVKSGEYRLVAKPFGYAPVVKSIVVEDGKLTRVGVLKATASTTELKQAEVISKGPELLNGLDRKVYDVKTDLQVQGGSGTDVLRQVPNVSVDIDGNIALRGQENVTILIDGRPAAMLGMVGQNAFDRIPASGISKVEVLTNPGAKFQADGTGGILNIVTTKNTKNGLNGDLMVGMGSGDKYTSALNVSKKVNETNLFLNASWDDRFMSGIGRTYREYKYMPDTGFTFLHRSQSLDHNAGINLRSGVDFVLGKQHSFNLSAGINDGNREGADTTRYKNQSTHSNAGIDTTFRTYASQRDSNTSKDFNYDVALRYEYKYKMENRKWTADVSFSDNASEKQSSNYWTWDAFYPVSLTHGAYMQMFGTTGKGRTWNFQTDAERAVGKAGKLEWGARSTQFYHQKDQRATQQFTPMGPIVQDSLRSFLIESTQWLNAAYMTYGYVFNTKWKAQAGVRYEQANLKFLLRDGSTLSRVFPGLFPSVFATYTPKKGTDIQLSYSMKVDRPGQESLNPIVDYTNPQSIRKGNPNLKPQYTHAVELNTVKFSKKGSISGSTYFRHTTNMFSRYLVADPSGIVVVTWENYNTKQSYGFSGSAMGRFLPWMNLQTSADVYFTTINGTNLSAGLQQSGLSWNARANASIDLNKIQQVQLTYMQMGAGPTGQGWRKPMGGLDIGYKVDLFHRKVSVSARLSDVFNTKKFGMIQDRETLYFEYSRSRESRIFFVNVQYRFGQPQNPRSRNNRGGMPSNGGGSEMIEM